MKTVDAGDEKAKGPEREEMKKEKGVTRIAISKRRDSREGRRENESTREGLPTGRIKQRKDQ